MNRVRNIVHIDQDRCNGCGLCVSACAEGAIQIINGKAQLVSDTYCDGLGACLGTCPQDAITIEQRQADPFDLQAAMQHQKQQPQHKDQHARNHQSLDPQPHAHAGHFVCPSMTSRQLKPKPVNPTPDDPNTNTPSQLANWPVQLKLIPPNAPYLKNADLLIVADCVPFALPDFHTRLLKGNPSSSAAQNSTPPKNTSTNSPTSSPTPRSNPSPSSAWKSPAVRA